MNDRDKRTTARILTVNHAGEAGAIRIYQAQSFVCRRLHRDLVPFLEETLAHEIEHKTLFRDAMPSRGARPCRTLWLWGLGGWLLGFVTAMMGKNMVWICTEAVEETVHKHLEDQLFFLDGKDNALATLIKSIQEEELSHLHHAQREISTRNPLTSLVSRIIALSTEIVIWLSTQGDSAKMARAIKRL